MLSGIRRPSTLHCRLQGMTGEMRTPYLSELVLGEHAVHRSAQHRCGILGMLQLCWALFEASRKPVQRQEG